MGFGPGDLLTAIVCLLVGFILRWSVTQFPYSGEGKPPKFGDYEAQRHWMEITTQLPIEDWYVDGPDNDLQYWGLDYPPLSAYHSYTLGVFFWHLLPQSINLHESRGFESDEHKFWMRFSVLCSDVFVPAIILFFYFATINAHQPQLPKWIPALLALMAPPFILIDYAHFQYNCVSLGLTVLAILCIAHEQMSIGAILYTLAVNHKQMSLYHALPFFIQMAGTTVLKHRSFLTTFRVILVIASTMVLLWLPFGEAWSYVLGRIFPLKRGVYEDKVGSFWFVLDRLIHLKGRLPDAEVAKLCGIISTLSLVPTLLQHLKISLDKKCKPEDSLKIFLLSLMNSSLLLFLFSYHVHEKSIMLAVLPAVLLFPWYPLQSVWFTVVAALSLYPLLLQEGSQLALVLMTIIYVLTAIQAGTFNNVGKWTRLLFIGSILSYLALIGGIHLIPPPPRLPHLYQTGIAILSFLHYAAFGIHFHLLLLRPIGVKVEGKLKSN